MITIENFRNVLEILGFIADIYGSVFTYTGENFTMSADFTNKRLIYPEQILGREHNTSLTAPENFVVFECVYRLLTMGYLPEDLELEKAWTLGRTQKGGRADICVYEKNSDDVLMIIECKTWGREFDTAKSDTLTDGAQLFSYWQQENSAKWLVLYASDLQDGKITFKAPAVNCSDDPNLLLRAENDDSLNIYERAHTAVEKFAVWQETYNQELHDSVIFSSDSQAYNIGIKPLRKRNLIALDKAEGIVNKFEEILRHNNVSDKENAFNRLIALFICKLVDELTTDEDSELAFQYRPRADSYETLQDRLQHLYTEGMNEFMKEEITYIPADYPERFLENYNGKNRRHAIDELKEAFRKLKYYTNNDFAFKDVHNEKLFYQNGKVLAEVVQLFQNYSIVNASQQQVLGDMFEQLLDKGFKQNEGQFFTPMPITRFIWDCLPMRRYDTWPKVIDYACGAGHFLIEAVEAINYFIPSDNNHWTRDHIFGIEKDYRLARVSKVSMFMNGAGDSSIIFGDGLENSELITPGTFDILTANPPYSVASFKQHLVLKENSFTLLDSIGTSGSEIEVLFVERIGQLLASGGIAAVILPSSILSNSSDSYTGARKEILSKFMILAIVKLGSKTFGATGTNTVILFLERYAYPPERSSLVKDSRDAILEGRDLTDWEDEEILRGYLELQGLSLEEWGMLVNRSRELDGLPEYFRNYREVFDGRKENVKLYDEKPEEYVRRFWEYVRKAEGEKLFYYGMTYKQRTVVVIAPSDNAGQKEFLGYDWSSRKGAEGIQYVEPRGGKMYVQAYREAEGTIADVVRQAFSGGEVEMRGDAVKYSRVVRTVGMLDFSRAGFDAAMRIIEHEGFSIESKYPMRKLSSLATMLKGGKSPVYGTSNVQVIKSGQARGFHDFDFTNHYYLAENVELDERKLQKGDLLINSLGVGTAGRVTAFDLDGDYVTDGTITIFRPNNEVLSEYVLVALGYGIGFKALEKMAVGATGQVSIKLDTIRNITIPLPPMDIQHKISDECQAVDSRSASLTSKISQCREHIETLFREVESLPSASRVTLGRVLQPVTDRISTNQLTPNQYVTTDTMLQKCEGIKPYTADLPAGSVIQFQSGDILLSNIRPYLQKLWLADFDGGCSPDVLVFRSKDDEVCAGMFAYYAMRREEFFDFVMQDVKGMKMPRGKREHILDYVIPLPSIEEQRRFLHEVLTLEAEIAQAKKDLESLSGEKSAILKKYL